MFRIFRRIRGDILANTKANSYVLYAAGELVLVVVGILIALQINNWNEERIQQNEIREYALSLSAAIERDMGSGDVTIQWNSRPGRFYSIDTSSDMNTWIESTDGYPSQGENTQFTERGVNAGDGPRRYYRVRRE